MRAVLIMHAVVGAAVVASITHLVVWLWPTRRSFRWKGVQWLAATAAVLSVLQFLLGNLIYPAYKLEVRVGFFDQPVAVAGEAVLRDEARKRAYDLWKGHYPEGKQPMVPPADGLPLEADLSRVSRAFDIKEHLASLALAVTIAACALAFAVDPRQREQEPARHLLFAFCLLGAVGAWLAGLIGLWTTAFRAVGGLT